jgi:alkaline phosphatase
MTFIKVRNMQAIKRIPSFIILIFLLYACQTASMPAASEPAVESAAASLTETRPPETETTETSNEPPTLPASPTASAAPEEPVRAIILLIGDGMGAAQREAARLASLGLEGALAMDTMPVQGWSQTAADPQLITDSAAGATALASGIKTSNGRIGMDKDGDPLPTILEQAQERGWAVGLVTTVNVADATPAAFAAHVSHRDDMEGIALQMFEARVDVLLGGGEDQFLPEGVRGCFSGFGQRDDNRNLIEEAQAEGYNFLCDGQALASFDTVGAPRLLGLFADEGMLRPFVPDLITMTQAAVEILSQDEDGFFLMVEGGQIDWAAHDNQGAETIASTIGFDAAVAFTRAYAEANPNTLVIVTADHETGGMSVTLEEEGTFRLEGPFAMPDGAPFWVDWTTSGHTPVDVPVSAQGPFSDLLAGIYPNTFIYDVMYAALTGQLP